MPSSGSELRNAGAPQQAENRRPGSGFLLLDIVDDLGHVVLVLAEFGGVLDQFLVLLFLLGLLERYGFLFLLTLDHLDILGVEIGIEFAGGDRRQRLLDRRRRPRAPRLQKRLGVERRRAFRADHRVVQQIVIAGAAARADALGASARAAAPAITICCTTRWSAADRNSGRRSSGRCAWCPIRVWPTG